MLKNTVGQLYAGIANQRLVLGVSLHQALPGVGIKGNGEAIANPMFEVVGPIDKYRHSGRKPILQVEAIAQPRVRTGD